MAAMTKRSAGILLWRRHPQLQLLLGHPGGPIFARKDDGVWSVPKGELDPDEEPMAGARREFEEELGLGLPVGQAVSLGDVRLKSGKLVTVFAQEGDLDVTTIDSNLFAMRWPPRVGKVQHFAELDRAGWFTPDEARAKLTPSQLPFVDRLLELVAATG
jgi:predicted NUDIX family NTP pyrophosphohydrolase